MAFARVNFFSSSSLGGSRRDASRNACSPMVKAWRWESVHPMATWKTSCSRESRIPEGTSSRRQMADPPPPDRSGSGARSGPWGWARRQDTRTAQCRHDESCGTDPDLHQRHGGHALDASARAECSRMRHEGPLMLNTTALCMSRSRMAPATTGSPNTSPQAGRPRLVVTRVGWPFS